MSEYDFEGYKPPEVLQKYWPTGFFGEDKDGCPVKIEAVGQIDLQGILRCVPVEEVCKYKAWQGEEAIKLCKQQSEKLGREVTANTVVFDLEGAGMRHVYRPGLRMMGQVANMYDEKYPGLTKQVIVVKAPRVFPIIYSIVSPLVSKEMKERVKVLGKNWKEELQTYIDADQLPEYYGGTRRDANDNPKCENEISYGGIIPEKYYSIKQTEKDNFTLATVGAGKKHEVDLLVSVPGSKITWQFSTDDKDIGFAIEYKPTKNDDKSRDEKKILSPMNRKACHFLMEEGNIVCDKTGCYTLVFDNSYSWLSSKNLYYEVKVENPAYVEALERLDLEEKR